MPSAVSPPIDGIADDSRQELGAPACGGRARKERAGTGFLERRGSEVTRADAICSDAGASLAGSVVRIKRHFRFSANRAQPNERQRDLLLRDGPSNGAGDHSSVRQ
jgi:hypothetical protein